MAFPLTLFDVDLIPESWFAPDIDIDFWVGYEIEWGESDPLPPLVYEHHTSSGGGVNWQAIAAQKDRIFDEELLTVLLAI